MEKVITAKSTLFSMLGLVVFSCGGPNVDVCISDPAAGGLQCVPNSGEKDDYFLNYGFTENFVCYSPRDHQKGIEYFKRKLEQCRQSK